MYGLEINASSKGKTSSNLLNICQRFLRLNDLFLVIGNGLFAQHRHKVTRGSEVVKLCSGWPLGPEDY